MGSRWITVDQPLNIWYYGSSLDQDLSNENYFFTFILSQLVRIQLANPSSVGIVSIHGLCPPLVWPPDFDNLHIMVMFALRGQQVELLYHRFERLHLFERMDIRTANTYDENIYHNQPRFRKRIAHIYRTAVTIYTDIQNKPTNTEEKRIIFDTLIDLLNTMILYIKLAAFLSAFYEMLMKQGMEYRVHCHMQNHPIDIPWQNAFHAFTSPALLLISNTCDRNLPILQVNPEIEFRARQLWIELIPYLKGMSSVAIMDEILMNTNVRAICDEITLLFTIVNVVLFFRHGHAPRSIVNQAMSNQQTIINQLRDNPQDPALYYLGQTLLIQAHIPPGRQRYDIDVIFEFFKQRFYEYLSDSIPAFYRIYQTEYKQLYDQIVMDADQLVQDYQEYPHKFLKSDEDHAFVIFIDWPLYKFFENVTDFGKFQRLKIFTNAKVARANIKNLGGILRIYGDLKETVYNDLR